MKMQYDGKIVDMSPKIGAIEALETKSAFK